MPGRPALPPAGLLLGFGLGGFLDGILLHEILQWHHMASERIGETSANVLADGLFHAAMWIVVAAGVALLWRTRTQAAGRSLAGGLLVGAGLFHVIDGIVSHWLLDLHHIRPHGPGGTLAWDVGFLALGIVLVGVGLLVAPSRPARGRIRSLRPIQPGGG